MHYEDRMLFFCSAIIKKNWPMIFHFSRQSETLLKFRKICQNANG